MTLTTLINVAIICASILMFAVTGYIVVAMIKKIIISAIRESTTAKIEKDTRMAIHANEMEERRYRGA